MSSTLDRKKNDDVIDEEEIDMTSMPLEKKEPTPALAESEDPNFFDINPMRKNCTFCSQNVVTYVEHEVNPLFGLSAIACVIIFGLLSAIILPVAFMVTKNAVHRCSRCLQKMGEKRCFGLPDDYSEPIWHFKLGKCSIITSRVYAIVGLVCFSILAGYYVYMRPSMVKDNPLFHHNQESQRINETWPDYLKDCGGEKIIENYVHAKMVFNDKYENNIVHWDGYFAEVKSKQRGIYLFGNDHYLSVLVKMSPSESTIFADLVLSISQTEYNENKAMYDSLKKGDQIRFKAKLLGLGNEFKMHHLHSLSVEKTGAFKEIDEIIVRESSLP